MSLSAPIILSLSLALLLSRAAAFWLGATLALPRQAVIIPGEAALTQRGAPVGNRLALQHRGGGEAVRGCACQSACARS